ncbi:DNA cytosine methyltransferase [Sphingomonas pseudosanguinis]|uniref:DNA cytosine methyltransferase n=1 Tax=Sphingomonas pseudosanguinis TaxID=413712 RepID=UPI003F855118
MAEALGIPLRQMMLLERGLAECTDQVLEKLAHLTELNAHHLLDLKKPQEPLCGEGYVTARPEGKAEIPRRRAPSVSKRPVMDLFCGVGGFSFGFEQTGEFEVVAGIDLLGDRLSTFCTNHDAANAYGQDIRSISTATLDDENPRPFVIVGGPPCQGFSSLRPFRNVDWNDPRNNLAEEFVRIVAALQPEWLVFENVVGLLTYANGRAWRAICEAFEEVGYTTDAKVLNGASFGLPQKRERLIIVGNRSGKRFKWPVPTHSFEGRSMAPDGMLLEGTERDLFRSELPIAVSVMDAIGDLPPVASGEGCETYTLEPTTDYQRRMRAGSKTLTLHDATRHSAKMLEIIKHAGANINALPPGMVTSGFSSCYSRLDAGEPSTTITVNFVHPASNRCIHPTQHRALTPREGARLQGFPDRFTFEGTRSQIVKQIGNAVPPLLGQAIAEAILASD